MLSNLPLTTSISYVVRAVTRTIRTVGDMVGLVGADGERDEGWFGLVGTTVGDMLGKTEGTGNSDTVGLTEGRAEGVSEGRLVEGEDGMNDG